MPTTITYEQNAMMVAAHLRHDDGSHALVYAAIPGGRCRMADGETRGTRYDVSVDGSPTIDNMRDFKRFVAERFSDDG